MSMLHKIGAPRTSFLILAATFLLSACDSGVLWEDGEYAVAWTDVRESASLYLKTQEGQPSIFRAGPQISKISSDDDYVFFVQEAEGDGGFFVLVKSQDDPFGPEDAAILGPFEGLEEMMARLGLANIPRLQPI